MEWEGLLRKLVHFRLNPLHSPPIILFYPNKPKWKFCLVMSFPRCLYLFQYYLLNCMMLACINIWIRWDGDGQMNGKIWWKPTSSSNNRELWKYLYIMGVYLVLASCLFFFCIITYFGHPMAKIQMPHWALARPGAFSMSPLSSPFTSSVVIFFQRQYGSLRLY